MGTSVDVELWSADARHAQACAELVIDEMHRINRRMSPHLADSELARINREAAQHAVPLSEEMFTLLSQALSWSARTDGAFDISFASVGQHYDYRQGRRPNAATLAQARQAIGWHCPRHGGRWWG
jgi:thiamine biosynthesis lipoprotein